MNDFRTRILFRIYLHCVECQIKYICIQFIQDLKSILFSDIYLYYSLGMFKIYHDIFAVVTECTGLMYGQNCNISCGHCIKSDECHHINGTCMNGCNIGYQGLHCTEGKTSEHNVSNTTVIFITTNTKINFYFQAAYIFNFLKFVLLYFNKWHERNTIIVKYLNCTYNLVRTT